MLHETNFDKKEDIFLHLVGFVSYFIEVTIFRFTAMHGNDNGNLIPQHWHQTGVIQSMTLSKYFLPNGINCSNFLIVD